MRSMTGYGEAAAESAKHAVAVSLRAVNHRFLDLQVRLAEECRGSESALRDLVGKAVSRGRVEMRVEVRSVAERKATVQLHRGVVEAAYAATHQLVEQGLIEGGLSAGDLPRIPQALRVERDGGAWADEDQELLVQVAGEAVAQLVASRDREGASLAAIMDERLG